MLALAPIPPAGEILAACIAAKISPATRRAYASDLRSFAAHLGHDTSTDPHGAALAILGASPGQVIAWRDSMIVGRLAPATVARRLSALRTFYRFARSAGACDRDPAELVEAPKVQAALQRAPSIDTVGARCLLDAPDLGTLRGLRDRAILGLLACLGLRRAEVAGLRLGDLLPSPSGGILARVMGKGGRVRILDVDPETAAALARYLEATGRKLGETSAEDPVFLDAQGAQLRPDGVDHIVSSTARHLGVVSDDGPRVSPHALRRVFATTAIDEGATLESLRRTMGHADPRTTARYDRRRDATVTVCYGAIDARVVARPPGTPAK